MSKFLHCHTAGYGLTVGKTYTVTREDTMHYEIFGDDGIVSMFTKEPDYAGKSVHDWFTIEDEDTEYRWKVIEVLPDGSGGALREERFYDEYRHGLTHVLQAASLYNGIGQHEVYPRATVGSHDVSFFVRGKGDDDFIGQITLERTAE